ncbi:hypothetical protein Tco_0715101 [Tanacetum coccineum]
MSEGLEHGIEHGKVGRDLEAVEAYDPEAYNKYLKALQELKDLKYPLVDQLEGLKDAPMELIMASDGVLVSAPTVAPQGLAILLADASTQTEITEGETSPRLLRSMSLPAMYNLDWP